MHFAPKGHFLKRRYVIPAIAAIAAVFAAGAAYAYFTTSGGGTGATEVGKTTPLVVNETGVTVYNSTIALSSYFQDQCLACASLTEFGNEVTLASASSSQLLSTVVVSMRNWGAAIESLPITLTFYNPGTASDGAPPGSVITTDTQKFYIPAAQASGAPTPFNITFNFNGDFVALPKTVVYGISFDPSSAPALNIALSSSGSQITVGSDPYPGNVFVDATSSLAGFASDAGTCVNSTPNEFSMSNVWCGDTPADNYGAYGSSAGDDIPAIEINDAGTGNLYPNGPAQTVNFSVTNPGSVPQALDAVTLSVASDPGNGYVESIPGDTSTDVSGCYASWFQTTGATYTGVTLGPHQSTTGTGTISMTDNGGNQDACEGATIGLEFTAS